MGSMVSHFPNRGVRLSTQTPLRGLLVESAHPVKNLTVDNKEISQIYTWDLARLELETYDQKRDAEFFQRMQ